MQRFIASFARIGIVAVLLCNLYAFLINFPRYAAGWEDRWELSKYVWQPPLGFVTWVLVFVSGGTLLAYGCWRTLVKARVAGVSKEYST